MSGVDNMDTTLDTLERFYDKVDKGDVDGCWLWKATKVGHMKYGSMRFRGRMQYAHRVSFIIHLGEIPQKMFVCHACDIPQCVNPRHLFLGTASDNKQDSIAKGRSKGKALSYPPLTEQ